MAHSLDDARTLLPFPMLGVDTDNGSEFINFDLVAYCEREAITFTRGRAYKKNDQCYVEQKNGSIVRQFIGYDRFEGERAYRQLTEVYRAVRLYVNFFQPSMKLRIKHREGSRVSRKYDQAQTPYQRLLHMGALPAETQERMAHVYAALDPVRLLRQIQTLQHALWQHAVVDRTASAVTGEPVAIPEVRCEATSDESQDHLRPLPLHRYHRSMRPSVPRTWRTRPDPFATVWLEATIMLAAAPERTAKSVLSELQKRYPGQYPDAYLRTLQRRVKEWRLEHLVKFDSDWLAQEVAEGRAFQRSSRVVTEPTPSDHGDNGNRLGISELHHP